MIKLGIWGVMEGIWNDDGEGGEGEGGDLEGEEEEEER